ncbi:MAG: iron-containing alcohol dehydrogenase [Candidatus Stahlbacteria bacterium]|nr:iron-containing alcohol dehydrogenase [Candidatus Stahlbacteria bacterium]
MKAFEYYSLTKIIFGEGSIKEIGNLLPKGSNKIIVVTGKHSSKANGSLEILKTLLKSKELWVFDEIEENPSGYTVNMGADLSRKKKVDLVIGLGGGSAIDAAKCIALLTTNDGVIENYLNENNSPINPSVPIIAIPTTAGTGSEVTHHVVVTVGSTKKGYSNNEFFPKIAILDPSLTISMPREITVNTGIDALTHAIEGYLSLRANPISDLIALETIKIIKEWLPKVVMNGKDIEARSQMLYASMLGGMVITQTGTIILHALGYPITTFYGIPHGRINGALLPWVLEFLKDMERKRINEITQIIGEVTNFLANLGVSIKLRDYKVIETDIPRFVQDVWGKRNLTITPKPVTQKDIENIYRQAL